MPGPERSAIIGSGGHDVESHAILTSISDAMADAVAGAAPSVVQVLGRRRPASGLVHAANVVVTTTRALGREDGLRVRRHDGALFDAELAGWDPATGIAVLRVNGFGSRALAPQQAAARVGHLAIAVARSWSNNLTASAGIISVIGGPLATGRRRSIDQVIRTTAPMHDGFSGGAFLNTEGGLVGMATAATIRGNGVVIPAGIVWSTAATVLEHGSMKRGYLGIAGQPAKLPASQRQHDGPGEALLVVGVTADSPAAQAGVLVGDLLMTFDNLAITSPEDLLDLLVGERVGRSLALGLLRGTTPVTLSVLVGERPGP
ncbi:MAG: PDZ domain-containing protein [Luteitalea sp.]|nr:PDZ domain-containing protein [Luteitalea sp.]